MLIKACNSLILHLFSFQIMAMLKPILVTVFCFVTACCFAEKHKGYTFTIDLVNVKNDKVTVQMTAPVIKQDEIIYYIPKIVPGTYSEDDFGRFVDDFTAFDKNGNKLDVEKVNVNGWKIKNARSLNTVSYTVNDTFDDTTAGKKIFEPTGSNIQADTNFIINTHCFTGYFDGMKQVPYKLIVNHAADFYGATAMTDDNSSATTDEFTVNTYNSLVDNPVMYCRPDTASIMVGESKVLISVYSPNKKVRADFLAGNFTKLLQAQAKYLGGTLPVKNYAFLIYLTDHGGVSGASGALEHSYSSMYFMPEGEPGKILQFFMDVASHEFFHIVTPLSIHSEEIQYFDFNEPKMSKHLWLYEGTTEYHAHIAQEKYGLITRQDFLDVISSKITASRQQYNDTLPFTVMSANCLHEYAAEYGNVYQKGALIAMCLDVKLRQLSNSKYGLMNLIFDLSKKYGKEKPFKDDELFDVIEKLTYPEIKQFLLTYVSGNTPLPLEEILNAAGIDYKAVVETKDSVFTLGAIRFTPNQQNGRAIINDISGINSFGKKMGYKLNDEIVSINGKAVTIATLGKTINELYKTAKPGDEIKMVVNRKNEGGAAEEVTLAAPMEKIPVKKYNQLSFTANPTAGQLAIQNSWLNAN